MSNDFPLLSLILFTPLVGIVVLLFVSRQNENLIRWIANLFVGLGFLVSLPLWFWYDTQDAEFQFVEKLEWIPSIGAQYFLGVDGFSVLLILLTTLMGVIAVLSSWTAITVRVKEYYIFLLALQTGMLGAFMALDFLLFFLFWEVMLVPMYFLIGIWGSDRRLYSAIKFFLFTLVGSVVMLLGILAVYFYYHDVTGVYTFDITKFHTLNIPYDLQWWIFLAFFLGFAVKVPMFPFHTWLPDAHTDAPTAASVILAAVLLKMGHLRVHPVQPADSAGRDARVRPARRRLVHHRHHLRGARGAGAEGLETAGGLLERQPHGHGHAGNVCPDAGRYHREHRAAVEPRYLDRRTVPPGRCRLRASPHAFDCRVRRVVAGHAGLRDDLPGDDDVVDWTADAQRLYRRGADPAGGLRREQDVGVRGGERHRARRCVHAVALSAHDVRQYHQSQERETAGPQHA